MRLIYFVVLLSLIILVTCKEKNLYKVLGVNKNANKKEIKKAYRKLAKKFHPDALGADATQKQKKRAEKKFIEVTKAYNTLYDEKKRNDYDKFGIHEDNKQNGGGTFFQQSGNGSGFNMEDIFAQFFDGKGKKQQNRGGQKGGESFFSFSSSSSGSGRTKKKNTFNFDNFGDGFGREFEFGSGNQGKRKRTKKRKSSRKKKR